MLLLGLAVGCQREAPPAEKGSPVSEEAATPAPTGTAPSAAPAPAGAAAPTTPPTGAARAPAPAAARPAPAGPEHEACADCHPDAVEGFLETGMGRSLYPPNARPSVEDFSERAATVKDAHTGLTYRAYVAEDGTWWQEERLPDTDYVRKEQVRWVIGSGNQTRSYLGEVAGEIIQMPLTWYARKKRWDLSPGYHESNFRFSRPVSPGCLFCHNDLAAHRPGTEAGYSEALPHGISCNRCHGDGAAHIAARSGGGTFEKGAADPTILNPARLDPQRQLSICQSCHLTGTSRVLLEGRRWDAYDVRTTPIEQHMAVYVPAEGGGAEFGIASHGARLALSACAQKSGPELGCTTCHDPHKRDDARAGRTACVGCHQPKECGSAHGRTDEGSCARCHMPRRGVSDIPHVSMTDHFIRKKPNTVPPAPDPDTTDIVDAFAESRTGDTEAARKQRKALAHAELGRIFGRKAHLPAAVKSLVAALKDAPEWGRGWLELGQVQNVLGDARGALRSFAHVERLLPEAVLYRLGQARAEMARGEPALAEEKLLIAVKQRPDFADGWRTLGEARLRQGKTAEAKAAFDRADALAPHDPEIPLQRGIGAMRSGDTAGAERFFREALARDATHALAQLNLAGLMVRAGQNDEALALVERTISIRPDFVLAYWVRARLRLQRGDRRGARSDIEAMRTRAPKDPRPHVALAVMAREDDGVDAARRILEKALAETGGRPEILEALQALQAGQLQMPD